MEKEGDKGVSVGGRNDVGEVLEDLMRRMLAKDPAKRIGWK